MCGEVENCVVSANKKSSLGCLFYFLVLHSYMNWIALQAAKFLLSFFGSFLNEARSKASAWLREKQ